MHPVGRKGVRQRARDVYLSDDFGEGLRAIFAGENEVAHGAPFRKLFESCSKKGQADGIAGLAL